VRRFSGTVKRGEKEKDSTYIQRIIGENFDAFNTLGSIMSGEW
jgi:hypothetical protein